MEKRIGTYRTHIGVGLILRKLAKKSLNIKRFIYQTDQGSRSDRIVYRRIGANARNRDRSGPDTESVV